MFISSSNNKKTNKRNIFVSLIKIIIIFYVIFANFAFFNISNNYAFAENSTNENIESELENTVDDIINDIDFEAFEELIDKEFKDEILNGLNLKEFVLGLIRGENNIKIGVVFDFILGKVKSLFREIFSSLSIIVAIVLLCVLFNNFKQSSNNGIGEIIYFVCFSIVVIILSYILKSTIDTSKNSIAKVVKQMNVLFPILLSLMSLVGGVVSVKAFSPMVAFFINIISNVFLKILFPLFILSLVLSIVGYISPTMKLSKLNDFIHSLFKWIVGIVFTIFIGYMSVQGITAGGVDGISIKATKYAIKNYVPMLGGYISDGFELIKAGGLLVKNATGVVGIIVLLSNIILPVLTIGIVSLCLKLIAGLIEPIDINNSSGLLSSVAKSLRLLVVLIIGVALMFFLMIYLIMCSVSNVI